MEQLSLRTYSRSELEKIFHTSRTDSIRRSLERAGYTFVSAGRGQSYTITITNLPTPPTAFETFVKREFNCGAQTDFKAMQQHFSSLFNEPEYQLLPSNHQTRFLKEHYGITVSDQSLRNWQRLLTDKNWIIEDSEKVKYYLCRKDSPPQEITEEEYKKKWREFFTRAANGEDENTLRQSLSYEWGGIPRKQFGLTANALEQDKIGELFSILHKSY